MGSLVPTSLPGGNEIHNNTRILRGNVTLGLGLPPNPGQDGDFYDSGSIEAFREKGMDTILVSRASR